MNNKITLQDLDDLLDAGFDDYPSFDFPNAVVLEDIAFGELVIVEAGHIGWAYIGCLLGVLAELEVDFQYERVKAPGKIMYVEDGVGAPYVNIFSNATKAEIFRKLIEIIRQERNK